MENAILALIKEGKEKFKYPIITIYVIVLILWNWDVLSYYFLSDSNIETKINYIEKHFNQNWSRILYPLCKAILLAVSIPAIMLGIEYLLQKINDPRRKIKFKNNESIRNEKLAVAVHEFKVEQEKTGKKTIEEWEEKVKSLEQRLDVQKLDNATLQKEKRDLDLINNGFLIELDKKSSQIEKLIKDIEEYNEGFDLLLNEITADNKIQSFKISSLIQNIKTVDEHDGLIRFNNELSDIDKSVLSEFIKWGIIEKESNKYFITLTGYPFLKYCKKRFPIAKLEQL